MARTRTYKLGLFVILALLVLLAVLLGLTGGEWRRSTFPAYTLFNESAQGLEAGAAVKFRGVTIGRVSRVSFRVEDSLIRVDMELDESNLDDKGGVRLDRFFEEQTRAGMRCQLQLAGITGLKYVETDYPAPALLGPQKDADAFPQPPAGRHGREAFYIPSSPSFMTDLTENISAIARSLSAVMKGIEGVDFQAIAADLRVLITAARKIGADLQNLVRVANEYASDSRLSAILAALSDASGDIRTVAGALKDQRIEELVPSLKQALENLNKASEALATKAGELDLAGLGEQIGGAADSVKNTADTLTGEIKNAGLPAAAASAQRTLSQAEQTMTDLRQSLAGLNRTLRTLTAVVEMIEQDPGSLLRGRRTPRTEPGAE